MKPPGYRVSGKLTDSSGMRTVRIATNGDLIAEHTVTTEDPSSDFDASLAAPGPGHVAHDYLYCPTNP